MIRGAGVDIAKLWQPTGRSQQGRGREAVNITINGVDQANWLQIDARQIGALVWQASGKLMARARE